MSAKVCRWTRWWQLAQRIAGDPRLQLEGVSTNYACFKGAPEGIRASVETVAQVARDLRAAGLTVPQGVGRQLERAVAASLEGQDAAGGGDGVAVWRSVVAGPRGSALSGRCRAAVRTPVRIRAEVVEEYTRPSVGGACAASCVGRGPSGRGHWSGRSSWSRTCGRSDGLRTTWWSRPMAQSGRTPVGAKLEMIPGV